MVAKQIYCDEESRGTSFVPFLYLSLSFLAFLSDSSKRGMNKLRVCNSADGSIPTAPTRTLRSGPETWVTLRTDYMGKAVSSDQRNTPVVI